MKNIILIILMIVAINTINGQNVVFNNKILEKVIKENLYLQETDFISQTVCDTMKILYASGCNIDNIYEIYKLPNLEYIDISNNNIKDMSVLELLPNLKYVNISNNHIETVSSIIFAQTDSFAIDITNNFIKDVNLLNYSSYFFVNVIGRNHQLEPQDTINTYLHSWKAKQDYSDCNSCLIKYRLWSNEQAVKYVEFPDGKKDTLKEDGYTKTIKHPFEHEGEQIIKIVLPDTIIIDTINVINVSDGIYFNNNFNIFSVSNQDTVFFHNQAELIDSVIIKKEKTQDMQDGIEYLTKIINLSPYHINTEINDLLFLFDNEINYGISNLFLLEWNSNSQINKRILINENEWKYDFCNNRIRIRKDTLRFSIENSFSICLRQAPTKSLTTQVQIAENEKEVIIPLSEFFTDPDSIPNDMTYEIDDFNKYQLKSVEIKNSNVIITPRNYIGTTSFTLKCTHDGLTVEETFNVNTLSTVSIEDISLAGINNVKVYPNPNNGIFSLEMNIDKLQNLNVELISTTGKTIYNEMLNNTIGQYHKELDISKYAKGIYFLNLSNGIQTATYKIVMK